MKYLKLLSATVAMLAIGACTSADIAAFKDRLNGLTQSENSDNIIGYHECPHVEVIEELSDLYDFGAAPDTADKNLASHVKLSTLNSTCTYTNKSASVDVKLAFEATLGPKGRSHSIERPFYAYPYFVAILSPGGNIMAKEVFAASMTFDLEQQEQTYYEGLRQIIPIPSKSSGHKYRIVVGFQLTQEQLAHNRGLIAEEQAKEAAKEQARRDKIEAERRTLIQLEQHGQVSPQIMRTNP